VVVFCMVLWSTRFHVVQGGRERQVIYQVLRDCVDGLLGRLRMEWVYMWVLGAGRFPMLGLLRRFQNVYLV
jgi:hypothetical protein